MNVLRFFYAECIDPDKNTDKFYLLTLERGNGTFAVRGRFGRRTGEYGGQETYKYSGPSHAEAEKWFERTLIDRQKHGYNEADLPNHLRRVLAAEGVDPARLNPTLARLGYRAALAATPPKDLRLIEIAKLRVAPSADSVADELVVSIDEDGRVEAVASSGVALNVSHAARNVDLSASGMLPMTIVLGRSGYGSYDLVLDVLELAAESVAELPGAERLILIGQVAAALGAPSLSPVPLAGKPASGACLLALDRPHQPADGSVSRYVVP